MSSKSTQTNIYTVNVLCGIGSHGRFEKPCYEPGPFYAKARSIAEVQRARSALESANRYPKPILPPAHHKKWNSRFRA